MLDLALADDGLVDAADVDARSHRRNVERHLQSNFPSGMHAGSDVNVDADIKVLKLGIDERIDSHSTNAGLKRTRRYRHAIADLQRRLLPVQSADLWILDELGVAVAQQRRGGGRRNGHLKVGGIEIRKAVQVDAV